MGLLSFILGNSGETSADKREKELLEREKKLLQEEVERLRTKEVRDLKKEVRQVRTEEIQHLDEHLQRIESGVRSNNDWPLEVMQRAIDLDGGLDGGRKKGLKAEEALRRAVREWNEKATLDTAITWREGYSKYAASTLYRFRQQLKKLQPKDN